MASKEEKEDLIDDLRGLTRYYMISLVGDYHEVVYGKSSNNEYKWWHSEEARRAINEYDAEPERLFGIYLHERQDSKDFPKVPNSFRRKRSREWYAMADIEYARGFDIENLQLRIQQIHPEFDFLDMSKIPTDDDVTREILPTCDFWDEFLLHHNNDVILEVAEIDKHFRYVFNAHLRNYKESVVGYLEVPGKIDVSKLYFEGVELPNISLLTRIKYDDEEADEFDGPKVNSTRSEFDVRLVDLLKSQ